MTSFSVRQVQHGWIIEWRTKVGKVEEVYVDRAILNCRIEGLTAEMEGE